MQQKYRKLTVYQVSVGTRLRAYVYPYKILTNLRLYTPISAHPKSWVDIWTLEYLSTAYWQETTCEKNTNQLNN